MAASQVLPPVAPAIFPQASYAGLDRRVAAHLIDVLTAFAVMMAGGISLRWLRALGFWTAPAAPAQDGIPSRSGGAWALATKQRSSSASSF